MEKYVKNITYLIFITHCILAILFGVFIFLGIAVLSPYSWNSEITLFSKLFGLDTYGIISSIVIVSFLETKWSRVKNVVVVTLIWAIINLLGYIILHFVYSLQNGNLINIGYYFLFVFLYSSSLIIQKSSRLKTKTVVSNRNHEDEEIKLGV